MKALLPVVAVVVTPALMFTCIVLFAAGFLNLVFAQNGGDLTAGSVCMALSLGGIVLAARARRRMG